MSAVKAMHTSTEELGKQLQEPACPNKEESLQSQPKSKTYLSENTHPINDSFRPRAPENQVNYHSVSIPQNACGRLEIKSLGNYFESSFFVAPNCGSNDGYLRITHEPEENRLAASSTSVRSVNKQNATGRLTKPTKGRKSSLCGMLKTKLLCQYNSDSRFGFSSVSTRTQVALQDHAVMDPESNNSTSFKTPEICEITPSQLHPPLEVQAGPQKKTSPLPSIPEHQRTGIKTHGPGFSAKLSYLKAPSPLKPQPTLEHLQANQYTSLPWKLDRDYQSRKPILKEAPKEALMETNHIARYLETSLIQDTTADLQRPQQVPPFCSHVYGAPFWLPNPGNPQPSIAEVFAEANRQANREEDNAEGAAQTSLEVLRNCISSDAELFNELNDGTDENAPTGSSADPFNSSGSPVRHTTDRELWAFHNSMVSRMSGSGSGEGR